MSLEEFKHSESGRRIAGLLGSEDMIRRMEAKSRADRPAIEAVGQEIAAQVGTLDDQDRKMVGRWIKEILARRGWQPDRKGRVAAGNFFARGTIYRRAGRSAPRSAGAARLAEARALLGRMPGRPLSSDELVAERHGSFGRDD